MANASFSDSDHGYRRLLASLEEAGKGAKMTIGIHAEEGSASEGAATLIDVAQWNEFGVEGHIEARPSITAWADAKGQDTLREARDRMAQAAKAGKSTMQVLDQLAQKSAADVQKMIAGSIPPPNRQSTIDKKGSSTTLINFGQLRASIRGKVGPR
jgi:hypothetical protein